MSDPFDASALPTPEEKERKQALDLTQGFALERNPEQAAEAFTHSRETGVKFEQAEEEIKLKGKLTRQPSWDALVREAPVLAERLSDPGRAAAIHDDVEKLKGIEKLVGGWTEMAWEGGKAFKRGEIQRKLANIGWKQMMLEATPEDLREAEALEAEMAQYPETELGFLPGIVPAAAESAPIMAQTVAEAGAVTVAGAAVGGLVGAAGGALAGGAGAGPGAIAGAKFGAGLVGKAATAVAAGRAEAGLALREFSKIPGANFESARGAAFLVGVVNGALEAVALDVILKRVPGVKHALKARTPRQVFAKVLKSEAGRKVLGGLVARVAEIGIVEGVTEALQELSNVIGETAVDPQVQGFSEAVARVWSQKERIGKAGVKGFQAGLGFGGLEIGGGIVQDVTSARKAQERKGLFEALAGFGKESKTRERLPEEYRAFVEKVAEKYGAVDVLTVPAEKLNTLLQAEGFTEADIKTKLPGVASQLAQAAGDPEAEITLLLPDFATHVAPLDGFASIQDDIRIGDEPTPREAVEIEKRAKEVLQEMKSDEKRAEAVPESSAKIYEDVHAKLTGIGMSEDVARRYATLWTAFSESRAQRRGEDPFDYYKGIGLQVAHSDLVEAIIPASEISTLTPEMVSLRERALRGDMEAMSELEDRFQLDELTKARNQDAWKRFQSQNPQGTYLAIDLNDLKRVNDTMGGHTAGDEFFRAVAGALRPAIQSNKGKFFRVGGDELAAHFLDRAAADAAVKQITDAMNSLPALFGGKHKSSISMGLGATYQQADLASVEAKKGAKAKGRSGFGRPGAVETIDLSGGDVFFHVDESPAPVLTQLRQDVDEDHAPRWGFQSLDNLTMAKQEKGDAKSWMSILSKGVKKEELEFLGIEEWLFEQGKMITKDQVREFIESHDIPVIESILTNEKGGLSESEASDIEDRLGNFGIRVEGGPGEDASFYYVTTDYESQESDDIQEIVNNRYERGEFSYTEKKRYLDMIAEMESRIGDEDAFETNSADVKALQGLLPGSSINITVEEDGSLTATGYIEVETENTLTDTDEIMERVRDEYGRRDASTAEELMDSYRSNEGSKSGSKTMYEDYTLKRGRAAQEGTYRELLFYAPRYEAAKYTSPHWEGDDASGLIAHARFSVHVMPSTAAPVPGKYNSTTKRVMFIEEIQSDLHQAARNAVQNAATEIKEMYQKLLGLSSTQMRGLKIADLEKMAAERGAVFGSPAETRLAQLKARTGYETLNGIADRLKATYNAGAQRAEFLDPATGRKMSFRPQSAGNPEATLMPEPLLRTRAAKIIFEEMIGAEEAVPDAPFKTTWDEFVTKRLLMWAAAEGFDEIAWPTGKLQAERYSLSQAIGKLSWRRGLLVNGREFEGVGQARAILTDDYVKTVGNDSEAEPVVKALLDAATPIYFIDAFDTHGNSIRNDQLSAPFTAAQLRNAVGAELAQKIIDSPETSDTISGPDLEVGGEGMKFAYDKKLVSFMEKQVKKFGGKVEQVPHPALTQTSTKMEVKGGVDPVAFAKDLVVNKIRPRIDMLSSYVEEFTDISQRVNAALAELPGENLRIYDALSATSLWERIPKLEGGIKSFTNEIDKIPSMIRLAEKVNGDLGEFENLGGYFPETIYRAVDRRRELEKKVEAGKRAVERHESVAWRNKAMADEEGILGHNLTDEERESVDLSIKSMVAVEKESLSALRKELAELPDDIDITSAAWWRETVEPAYRKEVQIYVNLIERIRNLMAQVQERNIPDNFAPEAEAGSSAVQGQLSRLRTAEGWLGDVANGSINDPVYGIVKAIRFGSDYSIYGNREIDDYELSAFKSKTGIDVDFPLEKATIKTEVPVWKADFPEELRKQIASRGMPLFQKQGKSDNYRGKIEFDDARTWFKVTLTGSANLSTFLHESGHAFLEILRRDAEAGDAMAAQDLAILEAWMANGTKDRTEQLEKFARGFEVYAREGRAPSSALAEAFAAFKAWLKFIYSSLRGLNVELTDEVRGVMDRMLASDIEIENARNSAGLIPVLGPTELDPDELQAFTERYERAVEAKRAELEHDALASLRRALKDASTGIRREVEAESRTRKDFNAAEFLRTGKALDGSTVAPEAGRKLSKATIREYVEEGDRRFIKLASMISDDGMDADALAPFLGYDSGQDLVNAILDAPSREKWIRDQSQSRMADKYPETDIAALSEQAVKKLHDPEIDGLLEAELDAFDRKTGAAPAPRARDVLRLAAKRRVEEMNVQEMQPGKYLRAEERAAKEVLKAASKKDYLTARDARRRQMWNRIMYREVTKAREEIEGIRDYLATFETIPVMKRIGRAGERYVEAIHALIEGVDLSRASNTALARRAALEKYLQEMEAEGEPVAIPPELRAELGLKSWKQMDLSELRAVRDAVKNIETLARLKNKLFDGRQRREFIQTTTRLAEHVRANVGVNYADGLGEPSWLEKKREFFRKARANMSKIEFIARALDGGKTAGWAHELLFEPLAAAQAKKYHMTKTITEQLMKPFQEMSLKDRLRFDRSVDFLGNKLRYREVIALILNLGNEGNRTKLLKGFNFTEEAVTKKLAEMHAKGEILDSDLDLVQHIWDTINKLWPEISALAQRNIGIAPAKVEPSPLRIGNRTLKGGYYPVVYNRRLSHKGEQIAQRKTGDLFENNFLLPAVEKGFTEARTQFFAPISLSLDVIPTHVNEVIHYLTHYEAVRAVDKITSSKLVREAITEGLGREVYGLFRPWLQAIAADGQVHESTKWYDAVLRRLRLGSSIALLGFKVTTGLKQIFGLATSAKEIGTYTLTGMRILADNIASGKGFGEISEISSEFKGLDVQHDRDMAAMFKKLEGAFSIYGQAKDKIAHFALAWMMLNQKAVNAVTWYGAREKAMREGHEDPVRYANSVVRMTQSGGGIKDLAAIQRGSEMERTMTVMYTYFSVLFNQINEQMPGKKTRQKVAILAARWWWLVTLPVLLDTMARAGLPDEDEDKEKYLEAITTGQILYFGRSIPLAGQVAESFIGERQVRYGAWIETLLRGASSAKDVAAGDATPSDVKNVVDLLGAATGLPASAAKNVYVFADEYLSGSMDEPIQNLLFRTPGDFK